MMKTAVGQFFYLIMVLSIGLVMLREGLALLREGLALLREGLGLLDPSKMDCLLLWDYLSLFSFCAPTCLFINNEYIFYY